MKRIYYFLLVFILIVHGVAPLSVIGQKSTQTTAPSLTLPMKEGSVRFMAVGDTGRGNLEQNQLAQVMFQYHKLFPFEFVILTGDNIYYQENAEDMKTKF